jgi:hypothetical protein
MGGESFNSLAGRARSGAESTRGKKMEQEDLECVCLAFPAVIKINSRWQIMEKKFSRGKLKELWGRG